MHDPGDSAVLIHDGRFEYETGMLFPRSVCRLRLFQRAGCLIALGSELADNPGASITNSAAALATALVKTYQIDPERVVFIEHYDHASYRGSSPEPTFDLLRFTWTPEEATKPQWRRINEAELASLGLTAQQLESPPLAPVRQLSELLSLTSLIQ